MKDRTNGAYDRLEASLQQIPRDLGRTPKAVLVISGHWEEPEFTVMTTARPPMIYDYYGFPEHTYKIQYPAPGAPETAERVRQLIAAAGIPVGVDNARGFDHGTFSPLVAIYPQADVPVFQLSMKNGYDPAAHLAVGRALAPLREEGVLIVGSGLSYHNLREFGPQARQPSAAFDQWLDETLVAFDARAARCPIAGLGQSPVGARRPSARGPSAAADGGGGRGRARERDPRSITRTRSWAASPCRASGSARPELARPAPKRSDHGAEQRADAGRQRHRQRAPERDAQRARHHAGAAGAGRRSRPAARGTAARCPRPAG